MKKKAIELGTGAFNKLGALLHTPIHLPGLKAKGKTSTRRPPGSSPGIEHREDVSQPPPAGTVSIQCIDYGPDVMHSFEVDDLDAFFEKPKPEGCTVRWININGLHTNIVYRFKEKYELHTLSAEDVLNVPQRVKIETYGEYLFIIMRMLMMREGRLYNEQTSIFYFKDMLITFQETSGDVWDPIRQRIENKTSRFRSRDASYLLYALTDAIVDHFFPILESYGSLLEEMEEQVIDDPSPVMQQKIHTIKRELSLLRRLSWPMRELTSALSRDEHERFSEDVRTFMRDVYDHAVQVIDVMETYREMASGLNDLYMSAVSNRMNEIMKVLTIMATLFIPITFVAGVYGMNFEFIPELSWHYSYPVFWVICITMVTGLLFFFRRKGWLGGSE